MIPDVTNERLAELVLQHSWADTDSDTYGDTHTALVELQRYRAAAAYPLADDDRALLTEHAARIREAQPRTYDALIRLLDGRSQ